MNTSTEDGPALICIPDITGFTRFMAETSLEFSRKIIPPLLRNLVTSNTLSLKVGEIEGDAILFYRYGTLPSFKELVDQCKNFYINFTEQLELLKKEFPDDFAKNISSNKLALKIVVHAAEMTSTHIEGIIKLIGEDVVVVHKILKNSIPDPEYILFTEKLLSNYSETEISEQLNWFKVKKSQDKYEYIGSIKYRHITLEPLLNTLPENDEKPGNSTKKN
ncbi:MAG: DUF2652 domain-containing protein [Bacteroidia bacterium]